MVDCWKERPDAFSYTGGSTVSSEYEIKLDENVYKVSIERLDEGGLLVVKVDDESFTIKAEQGEDGTFHINDTINDFAIKLIKKTGSKLEIEIDDQPRVVEWQRVSKTQAVKAPATTSGGGPKVAGGVYPPMPGKITEVHVSVGDAVDAGQTICILEAMKMFNELKAPKSGTVKEVNIETGSAVTPNDLLVLIE